MKGSAAYFEDMGQALDAAGECAPRLVVDLERLDANAKKISDAAHGKNLRLVDKSLPCATLLRRIMEKTGAHDFMSFHWPYLVQTARAFPQAKILTGKPLPFLAVEKVFAALAPGPFNPAEQITWLVDTRQCAQDYARVAQRLGVCLRVAIEIDVGMHRGGADTISAFKEVVATIAAAPASLRLVGLMGYDAHIAKAKKAFRNSQRAFSHAAARYCEFIEALKDRQLFPPDMIFNGAGSPTLTLHDQNSPLNDVSIGSAFVKPSGFDMPSLAALEAAVFIATPVLKRGQGVQFPFLEGVSRHWYQGMDTVFIYGGRWMANPVWPAGMAENRLYGLSSNQQIMTVPRATRIAPGDWVFFRPTQSEAVFTQFGDMRVYAQGEIVDCWPVYGEEISSSPSSKVSPPELIPLEAE